MRKRARRAIVILALALIPFVFLGIPALQLAFAVDEEERQPGVPVRLSSPELRTLEQRVQYAGNLEAEQTAAALSRLSGEVLEILVSRNDVVEAGQILARIEDDVPRLERAQARANLNARESQLRAARRGAREEEVENARAEVEQAEENLENAENDLERTRRLFEAGTISRSEFEDTENAFRGARTEVESARRSLRILEQGATEEEIEQAEAAVEAARRQYELAQLNLDFATVRAPVSGRITDVPVETGSTVEAGQPIAIIMNDDLVRASIRVPERRFSAFTSEELSPEAQLTAVAFPNMDPAPAEIRRIGSTIDPETRTFEVELIVDNAAGILRPGMFVNSWFTVARESDIMTVPDAAVVRRGESSFVFALSDDGETVRRVEVTPGLEQDGYTGIVGDIDLDTRVVVEGNSFLEDRQRVRVLEDS
ncbi:MAG: efflux RND transporter periplasmic adaptor subunit [Spirochaetaceae bacterium]